MSLHSYWSCINLRGQQFSKAARRQLCGQFSHAPMEDLTHPEQLALTSSIRSQRRCHRPSVLDVH